MTKKNVPYYGFGESELSVVEPAQIDSRRSKGRYPYKHGRIHWEELEEVHLDAVEIKRVEDGVWWKYDGKEPVLITDRDVMKIDESLESEAEKQAFHALQYMDKQGLVEYWGRK